jgi:DNA-directed RNA polymerase subunit RPC12/RpoP
MMNGFFSKKQNKNSLGYKKPSYKCLNCGKLLENPTGSPEARRFCNPKCREQYLGKDF